MDKIDKTITALVYSIAHTELSNFLQLLAASTKYSYGQRDFVKAQGLNTEKEDRARQEMNASPKRQWVGRNYYASPERRNLVERTEEQEKFV